MSARQDPIPAGAVVRGVLPPRPRLAVVGSRAAHRRFRDAVDPVVAELRARGWSLVSGGALGIDGAAHRAALAAGVGQIAVLPCGPDRAYPPAHGPLFEAIAAAPTSAVLYSHPAGTPTTRAMFVSRNRHVVGLADAVLVVEAARRSGTAATGRLALRGAIPVAAIVGSPGAAELVDAGATPIVWDTAQPDALRRSLGAWLAGDALALPWPADLLELRDALAAAATDGLDDATLHGLGLSVPLLHARLQGLVVEVAPGRWRRADSASPDP